MLKLALLLSVLLLSSCLEYRDDLVLHANGTGLFQFRVAIPADLDLDPVGEGNADDFFQIDTLKKRMQGIPGLALDTLQVRVQDGKKVMDASLRFDSLAALVLAGGTNPEENFIGRLSLRSDGEYRILERALSPSGEGHGPEDQVDSLAMGVMEGLLGTTQWQYNLQVPGRIVDVHPDAEWVDSAAGKVRWQFPVTDIARHPVKMSVRYQMIPVAKEKPSLLPLILSVLLLVGALYMLNRKVRNLQQVLIARRKDEKDSPQ